VSSHLLAEVEATCTHVAVLHDGTVVAQGELDELLESGSPGLLVSTPDGDRALESLRENRISSKLTPEGVRADLTATTEPRVVETLVRAGVAVYEVRRERTGLEDLFARLTQHEETGPHSLSEVDDVTR
jgi:ABC-2 type transport system ATP-binding protein